MVAYDHKWQGFSHFLLLSYNIHKGEGVSFLPDYMPILELQEMQSLISN